MEIVQRDAAAAAPALRAKRGERAFHPFSLLVHKPSEHEWVEEAAQWLVDEASTKFANRCRSKMGKQQSCNCFSILQDHCIAEAVASYLYFFGCAETAEKDRIFMDMLRYQDMLPSPDAFPKHCHYRLPFIPCDEANEVFVKTTLSNHFVCVTTLQHLLAYGRKKYRRI